MWGGTGGGIELDCTNTLLYNSPLSLSLSLFLSTSLLPLSHTIIHPITLKIIHHSYGVGVYYIYISSSNDANQYNFLLYHLLTVSDNGMFIFIFIRFRKLLLLDCFISN